MSNYRFPSYSGKTFTKEFPNDGEAAQYANELTDGPTPAFQKRVDGEWCQFSPDGEGNWISPSTGKITQGD